MTKNSVIKPEGIALPLDLSGWRGCVVEIGFGNGEYTKNQAKEEPEKLFVGIEVSHGCVLRAVRRLDAPNLRFMAGDARFLIRELFDDETIDRVVMNFPCPWPKERHAKRRVTAGEFSDTIASVLKRGGYFELMSDDEKYSNEVRDILGAHSALSVMSFEKNPHRPVTTRYEKKWLSMGKDIWRVRIKKEKKFTVERIADRISKGEEKMHVRLKSAKIEILDSLFDYEGKKGEAHWIFKRHFTHDNIHLIETVSTDSGFEQKYYLKVTEEPERVLVKIDGNSSVFLTPSVRGAIHDLAERIK